MRRLVGAFGPGSSAIGHVEPVMPDRVVGVQLAGGLGNTEALLGVDRR